MLEGEHGCGGMGTMRRSYGHLEALARAHRRACKGTKRHKKGCMEALVRVHVGNNTI